MFPRSLSSVADVLWRRFVDGYTRPYHEKYGDSTAGSAGDMLDLIEEELERHQRVDGGAVVVLLLHNELREHDGGGVGLY